MSLLETAIAPFAEFVRQPDAMEVMVNEFGKVFVEIAGKGIHAYPAPRLDQACFEDLGATITSKLNITNFKGRPYVGTSIPAELFGQKLDGMHRMQLCMGNTVPKGVAFALRLYRPRKFQLADFDVPDTFADLAARRAARPKTGSRAAEEAARAAGEPLTDTLLRYLRDKKNIVVSAGTAAGKTTWLNAMIAYVPPADRTLIIEEDAQELDRTHLLNFVTFLKPKAATNEAIEYETIINAVTRLRPDRVWLGEMSIDNTYTILRLLNTGHGGFLSTVHANSPALAFEAMTQNILFAKPHIPPAVINDLLRRTIDIIIQVEKVPGTERRAVTDVYIKEAEE